MLKKKIILGIIIISILFSTTACWDNENIDEIAFVTGIGFDKTEEGMIEMTVQLVVPTFLQQREQGSDEEAFWTTSFEDETVFGAVKGMLSIVNRRLFRNHIAIVVIGEELAREGMIDVLDFLERDHEMRKNAEMLVARGTTAQRVLQAQSNLEDIPSVHLTDIMENARLLAKLKQKDLITLLREVNQQGQSSVIGTVQIVGQDGKDEPAEEADNGEEMLLLKDMVVEGAAAFKEAQLVGWLSPPETRGYLFAQGGVVDGVINVDNPQDREQRVSIEIRSAGVEKEVELAAGEPRISVEVWATGNLGEQQGAGNLTTQSDFAELAQELSARIEEEIREVVDLAQQDYEADIFGFGELMRRQHPDYWQQVRGDWEQEFIQAPVEIEVETTIRKPRMIRMPTRPR